MPHWELHASFLSVQVHKQSCFACIECLRRACPSVFSSNGGRRCVSLAVLSLWGTMRAGSQVCQTRYKDSQAWVTSQRSRGEHHFKWCINTFRKKKTSPDVWCLWNTRTQCVRPPTVVPLILLHQSQYRQPGDTRTIKQTNLHNRIFHITGSPVIQTIRQTDLTSAVSHMLCLMADMCLYFREQLMQNIW